MLVELFEYPTNDDWAEVRRRALVTIGKKKADIPTKSWKEKNTQSTSFAYKTITFCILH